MRNLARFLAAGVLGMIAGVASAAAQTAPVDATVCDISNHPSRYDGKIVRVTGTVQTDFESFILRADSCSTPLWLAYPAGSRAKAGPAATITLALAANAKGDAGKVRPAVTLERGPAFDQFENLLTQRVKLPGMCLGCVKNDVKATLVGRVDGVDDQGMKRDRSGAITTIAGFGNMNEYPARLVIQSIANVSAIEIDYTKVPRVKDDNPGANTKDYMSAIQKTEASFPKGSDAIAKIERAIQAYGAPGVSNGVVVAFDGANEVPAGEGTKAGSSPDGLVLTLHIDGDKLKGDALSRAIAFAGEAIADLRDPNDPSNPSLDTLERKAWQQVLLVVLGARQKSLTMSGGTLFYSAEWPQTETNANVSAALTHYLNGRLQLPR
jgi:hypothetical protein